MSEFEEYAQKVTSGLDLPEAMKVRIAEEVVAHLQDETRRCMAQNMSRPDAERAAIERFGQEQIIGQLVAQALERRQARFRLMQNLRMAVAGVACVAISVSVGAWFQVFNDFVSSQRFMESTPAMVGPTIYVGGCAGCAALLIVVLANVFRVRKSLATAVGVIVASVVVASVLSFGVLTPHLPTDIVRGEGTDFTRFVGAFFARLYLCWVPTFTTGLAMFILARRRRACLSWLGAALATGFLSAIVIGINSMPYKAWWMYSTKWPTLLATGLLTLVFVMLAGFLARALAERFGAGPKATSFSVSDDSAETVRA